MDECTNNVRETISFFQELGFTISWDKSVLTPTHCIRFLGFDLNSLTMTVSVPADKAQRIAEDYAKLSTTEFPPIRNVAEVTGKLVACADGVRYGKLSYKQLEIDKIAALNTASGDFDQTMKLSERSVADLNWWIHEAWRFPMPLVFGPFSVTLRTDASFTGWCATCDELGS